MPSSSRSGGSPRIIVAGTGLVTPLGLGAWETFSALRAGRSITDRTRHLAPDVDAVELVRAVGSVVAAQRTATDPAVELAERAAREAAAEAGVPTHELPTFIGTSKGAVGRTALAAELLSGVRRRIRPPERDDALIALALGAHGYLNQHMVRRLGIDLRSHHVAACASSLVALDRARRFLTTGDDRPRYALVVTSEAALHPLFIHSYRRLGVLAPLTRDGYRERPLDEGRAGFVLAEAGAAVMLRRLDAGEPMPRNAVELSGTATAADPHDLIRPNPSMAAVRHLAGRLLGTMGAARPERSYAPESPADPVIFHPHAPGTQDHDGHEFTALCEAGPTPGADVPCYAAKGALGHTLGAAGLVSLVIATLCARTQQLPPMPWLEAPIDARLGPSRQVRRIAPGSRHAVFAAGFAGHAAGALLRHHP